MSIDLAEAFERHEAEFLKFERITNPKHPCRDVCAFLMLAEVVPTNGPMVSASEHDEFWLATNCDKLAEVATDELVRDLRRCGVMFSADYDSLSMFA